MKLKIGLMAFLGFMLMLKAQDKRSPWLIATGVQAVDVNAGDVGDYFSFNDLNGFPISYLEFSRYLFQGFTLGLDASYVKLKDKKEPLLNLRSVDKFAFGLHLQYALNSHLGKKGRPIKSWFDPYVRFNGGFLQVGAAGLDFQKPYLGFSLGTNIWFTRHIGLKIQTGYRVHNAAATEERIGSNSYFQHALGLTFRIGSKDTDNDGIIDRKDRCVRTRGLKRFKGCPDRDRDGVPDIDDRCPKIKGIKMFQGCPDTDKDGVEDAKDKCPKVAGIPEFEGCPDTDKDGIQDSEDECPKVAGVKEYKGCPTPIEPVEEVVDKKEETVAPKVVVRPSFYFDLGVARIRYKEMPYLDSLAQGIIENDEKIILKGYCDVTGSYRINQIISYLRADAVKKGLMSRGVDEVAIFIRAYGKNHIAANKAGVQSWQNRRVDVVTFTGDNLDVVDKGSRYAITKLHQVARGETIYSIAKQYGLTVKALRKLNYLTSNTIKIKQLLVVGVVTSSEEATTETEAAE